MAGPAKGEGRWGKGQKIDTPHPPPLTLVPTSTFSNRASRCWAGVTAMMVALPGTGLLGSVPSAGSRVSSSELKEPRLLGSVPIQW